MNILDIVCNELKIKIKNKNQTFIYNVDTKIMLYKLLT